MLGIGSDFFFLLQKWADTIELVDIEFYRKIYLQTPFNA